LDLVEIGLLAREEVDEHALEQANSSARDPTTQTTETRQDGQWPQGRTTHVARRREDDQYIGSRVPRLLNLRPGGWPPPRSTAAIPAMADDNDRDLNGHTDHGAGRARSRRSDAHGSRQRSQGDRAEQDHVGAARLRHGVNRDGSPRAFPRCMR
jgi:hypothetical protein